MSNIIRSTEGDSSPIDRIAEPAGRRTFLKWSGASVAGAALFLAGCSDEDTQTIVDVTPTPPTPPAPDAQNPSGAPAVTLNFANDFGILNFAFALEQLEAAFYTQVIATQYTGMTEQERRILIDIRDHEIVHREFFRTAITALGPTTLIGNLVPNFASINFASRESVLTTARTFEDLGIAAFNGAAGFLQSVDILNIAGKIVSVEARHASAIRDLLRPRSQNFAPSSLDESLPPSRVLAAADPFIQNPITVQNPPAGF
jgi:hypothetical protein